MHNESTLFRLIGGLLFHSPTSETAQNILNSFSAQDDKILKNIAESSQQCEADLLEADFFQLLQGSGDMPSPPWGSAYLDKENALFGSSTLEFREFIRDKGLQCDTGLREPEDHIGLMFMLTSLLLEQDDVAGANQLLSQHLMPFAPYMLTAMQNNAETNFYAQLAEFSLGWLEYYCEDQQLVIAERRNYWQETE
ncbi:putative Tat proofreading chaperone DmsD [Vibrio scophthalmi]|uniref:TorD/DmsD family molecular chaperone n=1 Tax=Vibrio scophthalmi TaxID=45658 RepID=UPI0008098911|nr:molecular chaperone [Vibrio scophthalmi]ANS85096.1 putative Tat proofreading chaperone DmsD [Vibrio scophthalmi]